jgi:serine/threonine protein kinase
VWSVAAILPELRTAFPCFPGETGRDQLACISEVLGQPSEEMYARCPHKEKFFENSTSKLLHITDSPRGSVRIPGSRPLEKVTAARRRDADFVDFLQSCLTWQAETRLTPQAALSHPWLLEESAAAGHHHSRHHHHHHHHHGHSHHHNNDQHLGQEQEDDEGDQALEEKEEIGDDSACINDAEKEEEEEEEEELRKNEGEGEGEGEEAVRKETI